MKGQDTKNKKINRGSCVGMQKSEATKRKNPKHHFVCRNESLRSSGHRRWLKGPSNYRLGDFLKMPPPQLSS